MTPGDAWSANDELSRRELVLRATRLRARPQFLIVDPTSVCNARCVMCHVSFRAPGERGRDLPPELFAKVAPLVASASHVNLFATGEPTVARDIVTLVKETLRRAPERARIWLCTNGKRLPDDVIEAVMGDPRVGLQFSVDGGTPEVFEAVRRGITFAELDASLGRVVARRGGSPHPELSFSSTISKRNVHDVAAIFALAQRHGVSRVLVYELDPEVPEEEAFVLDPSDRATFEAQLPLIDGTAIPYRNDLRFRGPRPAPAARAPGETLTCLAPWKVLYVRADGQVRTCCTLRESMGDLERQSVEEVWNGEAYVRLRRAFAEQSGIPDACQMCTDPLRTFAG